MSKTNDINLHLIPISLNPFLSKVAEEFVVSKHLKAAILKVLDENRYGGVSRSSISQALVKMFQKWSQATDGSSASVRIVLVDYQKALITLTILSPYLSYNPSIFLILLFTGLPIS